jgi:hypothetical protein
LFNGDAPTAKSGLRREKERMAVEQPLPSRTC